VNNQEILDNAPEGATHVEIESCGDYEYWRLKGNLFEWYNFCSMTQDYVYSYQNVDSESIEDIHSLADIKRIAELENQVEFEMGQKAIAREQRQRVISRLNSYLIKRANEIGECLPIYLVDHIKEFKGGAS
jgi:hypothetical protein